MFISILSAKMMIEFHTAVIPHMVLADLFLGAQNIKPSLGLPWSP